MKSRIIRYLLLPTVTASLAMCTSSNPTPQQPILHCRISAITSTYTSSPEVTTIQFGYNDDGFLTEMVHNTGKAVITYRGNQPYLLRFVPKAGGDWITQHEVTLYSNGTLKDITTLDNISGAKPSSTSFTKFSMTSTAIIGTKTVITAALFSWDLNNDMIRFVGEDESSDPKKGTYYTYYTDQVYAPKNVDAFTRYLSTYQGYDYIRLFGAPAYDTPHLVKEQKYGFTTSTFVYDFDDFGKITKITITSDGGAKTFVTPTYDCK